MDVVNDRSLPPLSQDAIASFCRQHGVRKMAIFGSAVTGRLQPQSDVDVLVEFRPDRIPDFFELDKMEQQLSSLMGGRPVDLVTSNALHPRIRSRVLREAQVQYAES